MPETQSLIARLIKVTLLGQLPMTVGSAAGLAMYLTSPTKTYCQSAEVECLPYERALIRSSDRLAPPDHQRQAGHHLRLLRAQHVSIGELVMYCCLLIAVWSISRSDLRSLPMVAVMALPETSNGESIAGLRSATSTSFIDVGLAVAPVLVAG